jgi:hypothetical protein
MSDLQDLIATNAVRAYNQGVERGAAEERERIVKLLWRNSSHYGCDWTCIAECDSPTFVQLIALIKGEQK